MSEGQGGAQQVAHAIKIMLVLLDGFNSHPFSWQKSLIAWGVARWRHELEISMTTTEEEPSPDVTETVRTLYTTKMLHRNSVLIFINLIVNKTLIVFFASP